MKSPKSISILVVAMALLAPACNAINVAPWPDTTGSDDAAAPDGSASDDASDQGATGAGGIQANYGPAPLRCDGGLCDTDNYSLCNIADNRAKSRAVWPLSALFVVAAMAVARRRSRRPRQPRHRRRSRRWTCVGR